MNPLTNMKNVLKLSEQELYSTNKTSWHDQYRDSAWVFAAGFPYDLTEGDLMCIFSQYGEIVHINLVRDKDTGKSRGFCFICYEDQRSTDLAVDNFNGIKILKRIMRVDHVQNYKVPKHIKEEADKILGIPTEKNEDRRARATSVMSTRTNATAATSRSTIIKVEAPVPPEEIRETLADAIEADIKLPMRLPIYPIKEEPLDTSKSESTQSKDKSADKKKKKRKKEKKSKKSKHKKRRRSSSSESSSSDTD